MADAFCRPASQPDIAAVPGSAALEAALRPFDAVRPFLRGSMGARALELAFTRGIVDALATADERTLESIVAVSGLPPDGLHLLIALLTQSGVVEQAAPGVARLSPRFRDALAYRDLISAKLAFAAEVASDFHHHLDALLSDRDAFMSRATVFELFRYDLAADDTAESRAATARWVSLTTGLTRYETPVLLAVEDFSRSRRLLDIGGNSGETARIICATHPDVSAVVADLPGVCAVGAAHLRGRPGEARIAFRPTDLRHVAPEGQFDTVLLKSVLHDWPDEGARMILQRAARAVAAGGKLVVFERLPLHAASAEVGYGTLPELVFHQFYRLPELYAATMRQLGLSVRRPLRVDLDLSFMLLVAERRD
jgi:SAM-dependent methyltransferase